MLGGADAVHHTSAAVLSNLFIFSVLHTAELQWVGEPGQTLHPCSDELVSPNWANLQSGSQMGELALNSVIDQGRSRPGPGYMRFKASKLAELLHCRMAEL